MTLLPAEQMFSQVMMIPDPSPHPPPSCSQSDHRVVSPAKTKTTNKGYNWIQKHVIKSLLKAGITADQNSCTMPSFRISCCFLGLTCFLKMCPSRELWLWFSRNSLGLLNRPVPLHCLGNASAWAVAEKAKSDKGHTDGYLEQVGNQYATSH